MDELVDREPGRIVWLGRLHRGPVVVQLTDWCGCSFCPLVLLPVTFHDSLICLKRIPLESIEYMRRNQCNCLEKSSPLPPSSARVVESTDGVQFREHVVDAR